MDGKSVARRCVLVQVERPAGHVVYRRQAEAWGGYPVKIVCAWCGKYLRTEHWLWDAKVSHGLCESCRAKLVKEEGL